MTAVLLFARARELAGTRQLELPGATVTEVLDTLAERFGPEFAALCATASVVVDGDTIPRGEWVTQHSGDELAVLPPVSGGAGDHDHHHDRDQHRHGTEGQPARPIRVGVLTVSDRAAAGVYDDETGPAVSALAQERFAADVAVVDVVPDDADAIAEVLRRWSDTGDASGPIDLVLTAGGTGLGARDVTPEATRTVLDVEAPGLVELMRSVGLASTPLAALSRQCAGRRNATIVVNLPGSVRGATESLDAVAEVLPHAVAVARGDT